MKTRDDTSQEIEMFETAGSIMTISKNAKANANGNQFYNFSAEIDIPRGKITCLGQVYENSFEFLGGKPEQGDKFNFEIDMDSLRGGNNKVWAISGHVIDEIAAEFLSDIESM